MKTLLEKTLEENRVFALRGEEERLDLSNSEIKNIEEFEEWCYTFIDVYELSVPKNNSELHSFLLKYNFCLLKKDESKVYFANPYFLKSEKVKVAELKKDECTNYWFSVWDRVSICDNDIRFQDFERNEMWEFKVDDYDYLKVDDIVIIDKELKINNVCRCNLQI